MMRNVGVKRAIPKNIYVPKHACIYTHSHILSPGMFIHRLVHFYIKMYSCSIVRRRRRRCRLSCVHSFHMNYSTDFMPFRHTCVYVSVCVCGASGEQINKKPKLFTFNDSPVALNFIFCNLIFSFNVPHHVATPS